jgi:hypothetical protein
MIYMSAALDARGALMRIKGQSAPLSGILLFFEQYFVLKSLIMIAILRALRVFFTRCVPSS